MSRLLHLIVSRLFRWLRLSRRSESWKSAEILLLRHQLTVLQRQAAARPKMTWVDRALIGLLLDFIPIRHRGGLGLIVTPQTVPTPASITPAATAGQGNRIRTSPPSPFVRDTTPSPSAPAATTRTITDSSIGPVLLDDELFVTTPTDVLADAAPRVSTGACAG
ncbi:MAG: hypothetical protein M3N95_04535 [Actinomycetota bacterium]|nr:hypothetical protein [Actinomycetota bacterium]